MIPFISRRSPVYVGTGAVATYAFSFKVFSKNDIAVQVTTTAGVESTLTVDTNYTVLLNADQDNFPGGSITLTAGNLATGYSLVIFGDQDYSQTTQLPTGGPYNAVIHEQALDRIVIMVQQLAERLGRAIVAPASDATVSGLPVAASRKDKALVFNAATGQPEMSSFTVTQLASVVAAIYAAAAGPLDALSFIQAGTGARSRTAQNKAREWVSVMDFGAIGDGTNHPLSERYATLAAAQVDYPFATALTQSIDWAAFQAAHDSLSATGTADERTRGKILLVPFGRFYLSDTWKISKRFQVMGMHAGDQIENAGSRLIWPANTTGIRCYSFLDSPAGTAADGTTISHLNLSSTEAATGYGIHATCKIYVEDCIIRDFKQDAIYINGVTGVTGNANGWNVRRTRAISCGGHGLHVAGNDAQVGVAELFDGSSNGGYAIYDNCAYANTFISCHAAGNALGSFYSRSAAGQGSLFLNCYVEYGAGATANFDSNVLVIGGSVVLESYTGNGMWSGTGGFTFNVPTGSRVIYARNGVEQGRIENTGQLIFPGGLKFESGAGDSVNMSAGNALWKTGTGTGAVAAINFQNGNGTVGSIQTNGVNTVYNTSSDYRLKKDVQPMTGALARVMQLKPVRFKWKADDTIGESFIAHELQDVFPVAVSGTKDETHEVDVVEQVVEDVLDRAGNKIGETLQEKVVGKKTEPKYQGIDTSFLVPTLVAALQELKTDFDAYKAAHP